MFAVECLDLTKDYLVGFWRKRPVRALSRLTLKVDQGEVFGFLGHNGAGKTTTLKLLLRLIFPTSGTARILGEPLGASAVTRHIGYLPENPYFYDYLTCRELVSYYAELGGLNPPDLNEQVKWALERVAAAEFADRPLRKCSKGMLQRVGLAQAIVHRPRVLFLDEPMSGLDPLGRREVRELILELKQTGAAVLFSTHILSDAEEICDRVAILHRGELRGCGKPDELLSAGELQMEVVWRGRQTASVAVQPVPGRPGEFRTRTARTQLWDLLERLRHDRSEIISIAPVRLSLEEIYVLKTHDGAADSSTLKTISAPLSKQEQAVSSRDRQSN